MDKTSIIERIEQYAPLHVQADWDSSGIQIESARPFFKHIALMLDPSIESIEKALALDCDFIISHHPLAMRDYRLNKVDPLFKVISLLLSKQVLLYSAHTSLDATKHKRKINSENNLSSKGLSIEASVKMSKNPDAFHDTLYDFYDRVEKLCFVSKWLGEELALNDIQPLDKKDNFGIVGTLKKASTLTQICDKLLELMPNVSLKDFRYISLDSEDSTKREIKSIALCTGSAASLYDQALLSGVDLYITGDVKYHDAINALQSLPLQKRPPILLDVGHFSLEEEMMRRFSLLLGNDFSKHNVKVSFIEAKNPYSYF